MLGTILVLLQIITAVIALALIVIRLIESIHQLSQTTNLNTAQKCWQVVKNFFTVERYKTT